jgi:hypothetical protein
VGWQVDVEPFVPAPDDYGPLLRFRFDRAQYERLLRALLTAYERRAAQQAAALPEVAPERPRWYRRFLR